MLDLIIPLDVLQNYLPNQYLTIPKFISFNLPCIATIKLTEDIYISSERATASNNKIQMLLSKPAPPLVLIEDLITTLRSASHPIAQSGQSQMCHKTAIIFHCGLSLTGGN
jgi:hypothetical protein